ncbi:MAG: GWxTD domain-containing protein [Cryomorphaceae bacterium]
MFITPSAVPSIDMDIRLVLISFEKKCAMRYFLLVTALFMSLSSQALDAYFNHAVFLTPEEGPYVETQMLFNASSLRYAQTADGFQSRVELTYIFESEGNVVDFSKNVIKSPFTADSLNAIVDFLDLQRFFLAPDVYDLTIRLRDLNNPTDTVSLSQRVVIPPPSEKAYFSDIVFMDTVYDNGGKMGKFSRGNVNMIPRISGYQGPDRDKLLLYTELYNTEFSLGGAVDYLIVLDILDARDERVIGTYHALKRVKGSEVQAVFHTWDITGLGTGNYIVQVEARNRNNEVIASARSDVQRHNIVPSVSEINEFQLNETFVGQLRGDTLRDMVYCMRYQASPTEERYIDDNWQEGDTTELRRFFYTFWRDRNAIDPAYEWKKYHKNIRYVENEFGLGNRRKHACRTDRGRVYLLYGKPDTRVQRHREPSASPYEIWHYYKTAKKSDAKFVFYDRTLVTNDFVMLHSNVPGEAVDYSWYQQLSTPAIAPSGNDEPMNSRGEVTDYRNLRGMDMDEVGSRALDYWNNPR